MSRASTIFKAVKTRLADRQGATSRPAMKTEQLSYWPERVAATRKWSRFMYGTDTFDPRIVVEHWTECDTQQAAIDYWNQSAEESWVHFIIDPAGVITQLAPLDALARHAYGVTPWAIGVEHVGLSDAEVMENPLQVEASYRLTSWLQATLDIPLAGVIGHGEVTSNSLFHFSDEGQKWIEESGYRFHHDFSPHTMRRYRDQLRTFQAT